jgi:hypothetical protein
MQKYLMICKIFKDISNFDLSKLEGFVIKAFKKLPSDLTLTLGPTADYETIKRGLSLLRDTLRETILDEPKDSQQDQLAWKPVLGKPTDLQQEQLDLIDMIKSFIQLKELTAQIELRFELDEYAIAVFNSPDISPLIPLPRGIRTSGNAPLGEVKRFDSVATPHIKRVYEDFLKVLEGPTDEKEKFKLLKTKPDKYLIEAFEESVMEDHPAIGAISILEHFARQDQDNKVLRSGGSGTWSKFPNLLSKDDSPDMTVEQRNNQIAKILSKKLLSSKINEEVRAYFYEKVKTPQPVQGSSRQRPAIASPNKAFMVEAGLPVGQDIFSSASSVSVTSNQTKPNLNLPGSSLPGTATNRQRMDFSKIPATTSTTSIASTTSSSSNDSSRRLIDSASSASSASSTESTNSSSQTVSTGFIQSTR